MFKSFEVLFNLYNNLNVIKVEEIFAVVNLESIHFTINSYSILKFIILITNFLFWNRRVKAQSINYRNKKLTINMTNFNKNNYL
jgi:hypothetical protein